jgi:homopolymeric O-antigen transport system ATP-binding protein
MSNVAIKVDNLSKLYKIGARRDRHDTLRDHLMHGIKSLFSRDGRRSSVSDPEDTIWALKDVSFELKQGEAVGIIGRNGAGKSTLLKILSRITEPTTGFAEIHGRVGSLLEVGTGFHYELSGRENIYLNGSILGMKREEIQRQFDAIVDFSGVEKFIDTPVKRYSSGMFVRLAFAVAAHLDSEILIVDEALAVGDAAFQKKCLGKMGDIASEGRTVLLVSHNMGFISSLTRRAMVLDNGKQKFFGDTAVAIAAYLEIVSPKGPRSLTEHENRFPGMTPSFTSAFLTDGEARRRDVFCTREEWCLELEYSCKDDVNLAGAAFRILTPDEIQVVGELNTFMFSPPPHRIPQKGRLRFRLPELPLCPGNYAVNIALLNDDHGVARLYDLVPHALEFSVDNSDPNGTGFVLTRQNGLCAFKGYCEVVAG